MPGRMKESGIEWTGLVPENWTLFRLKDYFSFEKGKNAALYTQDYIAEHSGEYPVYSGQTENEGVMGKISSFDYDVDECLFTTTVGAKVMSPRILRGRFSLSQNCLIMKQTKKCSNLFIYFALHPLFAYEKSLIPSYMQPSLRVLDLKKYMLFAPSYEEQKIIASFLKEKCGHIDDAIKQSRASVDDYKKMRKTIIAKAVTKGIKPERKMKDSGIEWVEEIPIEWESINPKALFSQRKEKAKPGERQLTASQQFGIVYQDEYMEKTGNKIVTVEKDFDILKHVEAGDFVISMRSFQGGLEYSTKGGSISSAYVMLIPNHELVYPRYYRWLLKSSVYINALQSTTNMVRDGQAMRYSNFAKVRLFAVPIDEQKEIADYLDKKCDEIDKLIEQKELLIEELENYKKSLIFEYVTGKKEV